MEYIGDNAWSNVLLDRVSWIDFQVFYDLARKSSAQIQAATSPFEVDESGETSYWLTADRMSGFAINYHGGTAGELIYVFSRVRGRGDMLVGASLDRGAKRLDCFDGYLVDLYRRHGFVEVDREANWTPGGPDVVFMERA